MLSHILAFKANYSIKRFLLHVSVMPVCLYHFLSYLCNVTSVSFCSLTTDLSSWLLETSLKFPSDHTATKRPSDSPLLLLRARIMQLFFNLCATRWEKVFFAPLQKIFPRSEASEKYLRRRKGEFSSFAFYICFTSFFYHDVFSITAYCQL